MFLNLFLLKMSMKWKCIGATMATYWYKTDNWYQLFGKSRFLLSYFIKSGWVPSRHQQAAALLLFNALWHSYMGPTDQQVCLCSWEPLQCRYIFGFLSGWPDSGQVNMKNITHFSKIVCFQICGENTSVFKVLFRLGSVIKSVQGLVKRW